MINIYLDQNKWIDLARAYYGRADGAKFQETLRLAMKAVERGRVSFPFSSAHYMEVSKDSKPDRRHRLARFLVELSKCRSMISSPAIMRTLVVLALHRLLNRPHDLGEPPIFGQGLNWVFGEHLVPAAERLCYPVTANIIDDLYNSKQELVELLTDPFSDGSRHELVSLRNEEHRLAEHAKTVRDAIAPYGKAARRMSYSGALFSSIGVDFEFALKRLNETLAHFYAEPLKALQLIDFIPPLDIERDLVLGRDFHMDRNPAGNDMLDITALSMAIAYCDVVVTERFWEHIARNASLEERYDTKVLSDVNGIRKFL